jgi:hypothetical protein
MCGRPENRLFPENLFELAPKEGRLIRTIRQSIEKEGCQNGKGGNRAPGQFQAKEIETLAANQSG